MKTLQQEIVEALNDGGDSAISCQIDFKLFHRLKNLSDKVESARRENCEFYVTVEDNYVIVQDRPVLITYPVDKCKRINISDKGPDFWCMDFKQKVK